MASKFVQRTEAPATTDARYYADNPFHQAGYGMPNCTCYAWGRFYEISGIRPKLSTGDAEKWWSNTADGYARGQLPKLGAVACWRRGDASTDSDGAGHVAIVEKINDDGSIVTSNSAWNSTLFYQQTLSPAAGYSWNSSYVFQGFIYNPVSFDVVDKDDVISNNRALTEDEMQINARYIWQYLGSRGWTLNAVAGMLGNMENESTINPGRWQNGAVNVGPAFGLVQWDPYTKYTSWCDARGLDPADMDSALQRIEWELETGEQYYKNVYPYTFAQFKVSTDDPYTLACAFAFDYERSYVALYGSEAEKEALRQLRGGDAEKWYSYLSGYDPGGGGDDPGSDRPEWQPTKREKMSLLLLIAASKGGAG